jgi:hypothetical protein
VLGVERFHLMIDGAIVAALMALHTLRLACQVAGCFPCEAASPTADTISNMLPILQAKAVTAHVGPGSIAEQWMA